MRNRCKFPVLLLICMAMLMVTGCNQNKNKVSKGTTEEETTAEKISYNASDVAVVVKIDRDENRISLKSSDTGSVYSVNYNGGTKLKSKYGNNILIDNVHPGMVVEAHYIEGTRKLVELLISDEAWENTMAVRWDVDYDKKIITIGSSSYAYDDNIFIYSDGSEIDIREVSGIDELTVRGLGTKVLSVVVTKGHGYIRLKDETNYVGGMVEVGDDIITEVAAGMIIAAPEGEHTVAVSKNGLGGEITVEVKRGLETIVSFAEFEQPVERVGSVNFIVTPDDAEALLYVDGVLTEYKDLARISYGDHKIEFKSNNYDTYTKEITIVSAYTTINVNMAGEEETEDSEEETSEDETTSSSSEDETKDNDEEATTETLDTGDEVIRVNAPEGASVYFDGVYKGVAPVSFAKQAGEHIIILRKDGYETKMYTIDVVSDGEDMEISLPDMLAQSVD